MPVPSWCRLIRKRIAAVKRPDPARMDALLGAAGQLRFPRRGRVGDWRGDQFANGGEQTLRWNLTPLLARAAGACSLSLSFRWTGGAPFALKAVRLFEDERELGATPRRERRTPRSGQPSSPSACRNRNAARVHASGHAAGGGDSTGVVLSRAEPAATFDKDKWTRIGGWGGKEIKAAPETAAGWHELEFDATNCIRATGQVFVVFKYDSYASPQVMNVRLFVGGRKVASDLHSCNPISGADTMYTLPLPSRRRSNAQVVIRALFSWR